MSFLITIRIRGDVAAFRSAVETRGDEFASVVERAKSMGALHHRFGVGDDFVLVIDEWESPADFEKFFGDEDMKKFVASIGADMSRPPEITVAEALETSDSF